MKKKNLIYATIIGIILIVSAIFIWNNYQNKSIKLLPQISKKCGIENCHGLNISCGSNVPDACTSIYEEGDNCRQFVSCQIIEGQCKVIKTLKFDNCKSCVEKCKQDYPNNPDKFFECESSCDE